MTENRCSPKTHGTEDHMWRAIRNHDIVFGIGPAGTGKTYIAVAMAVNALKNKEVQKIILARPAVEAGETAGIPAGGSAGKGGSVSAARCMMRCMMF